MRVDGRRRNSPPAYDLLRARIVGIATELVREQGFAALTLTAVGRVAHMRPESLLRVVRDLDEVRHAVIANAQAELVELMEGAIGDSRGREALEGMFESQRLYAQAQPHLYEAALLRLPRSGTPDTGGRDALAALECATLESCGAPPAQVDQLAWCFRAAVHGAICLEASDRLSRQQNIDENFDFLVRILEGAARWAGEAAAPPPVFVAVERRGCGEA
jgi:AcrR family transcriptional regulator